MRWRFWLGNGYSFGYDMQLFRSWHITMEMKKVNETSPIYDLPLFPKDSVDRLRLHVTGFSSSSPFPPEVTV